MKNKYLTLIILCTIGLVSYSNTSAKAAECFTYFKWCNVVAEITFNSSQLSQASQDEYVESVSECLDEYDDCVDPPKN